MPDSQPEVSELAREVVAELKDTRQIGDQVLLSRREAIALSTGAVSLGALGVAAAGTATAQEAAGQIGTESEPVDVEGAQGNFQALEAESVSTEDTHTERIGGGEYHYAGDYDGTGPDERLDNCLNEANDGHRIYLEHTTYSDDRIIDKSILISGPASTSGGSDVRIEGTWTLDNRIILKYVTCRTDDAIVVAADRCSLFGVCMGGQDPDLFVDADNSVISHIWASSAGQVTFADGTSGNEIGIVSGETTISDNGNNSVL